MRMFECISNRKLSVLKQKKISIDLGGIMIVISLEEKADEILQFFEKYDIYLSKELQFQIFDL